MTDANHIYNVFEATLSADPNLRSQAEQELRNIETNPSMISMILDILATSSSTSASNSQHVHQSISIYLKNRVVRSWRVDPEHRRPTQVEISPSDHEAFKARILGVLMTSPPRIKVQMRSALASALDSDWPSRWPGLIETVVQALRSNNPQEVEVGIIVLLELFKSRRYIMQERADIDAVAAQTMPILVDLGTKLMATQQTDDATGNLIYLITKVYKHSIHLTLSAHQQTHGEPEANGENSLVPWGMFLLSIVGRRFEAAQQPADEEERERWIWWRAKKWAYYVLGRLYHRYGGPSQLSKMTKQYMAFAQHFEPTYAPEIFRIYLRQVEEYIQQRTWLSKHCLKSIIMFFNECIRPQTMWHLLRPHFEALVTNLIFPFLCLSDADLEQFNDEPEQYCRDHFADLAAERFGNHVEAAGVFIMSLAQLRKKSTLMPMLTFIHSVLERYPNQGVGARQLDGALHMLGQLAESILETKSASQSMQAFFVRFLVPNFRNEHAFVRTRALEVIAAFSAFGEDVRGGLEWVTTEHRLAMLSATLEALVDQTALPVRVQAAKALLAVTASDEIEEQVKPNVGRFMQELLKLTGEIDLDSLSHTITVLVGRFTEEVQPFAIDLASSLVASYQRLLAEMLDARNREVDEEDDRALVAMELLKTLDQIVESASEAEELLAQLDALLAPALFTTIDQGFAELYDEAFELASSIVFYHRKVTPHMWQVFAPLCNTLSADGIDYIDEIYPVLNSYLSFGTDFFVEDQSAREKLIEVFQGLMASKRIGAEDRASACKIAQTSLLTLRGHMDPAVPVYLSTAMPIILRPTSERITEPVISKGLYLHAIVLALGCIFYNPQLALGHLEVNGWKAPFFEHWFASQKHFGRVCDKKLVIVVVATLLEELCQSSDDTIQASDIARAGSHFVVKAIEMFNGLPEALQAKHDEEENFDSGPVDIDDIDLLDEAFEDEDEGNDDKDVRDPDAEYMERAAERDEERMRQRAAEAQEDIGEDWTDEVLFDSPFDHLDAYERFVNVLAAVEQKPALAQFALAPLTPEQRAALATIRQIAHDGGEEHVKAQFRAEDTEEEEGGDDEN